MRVVTVRLLLIAALLWQAPVPATAHDTPFPFNCVNGDNTPKHDCVDDDHAVAPAPPPAAMTDTSACTKLAQSLQFFAPKTPAGKPPHGGVVHPPRGVGINIASVGYVPKSAAATPIAQPSAASPAHAALVIKGPSGPYIFIDSFSCTPLSTGYKLVQQTIKIPVSSATVTVTTHRVP